MPGIRLMDQARNRIRTLHYSRGTEKAYCCWIRYFIRYFNGRRPRDMGAREISVFLTFLATQRNVSASTQNQAFNALLFLYRKVLARGGEWSAEPAGGCGVTMRSDQ